MRTAIAIRFCTLPCRQSWLDLGSVLRLMSPVEGKREVCCALDTSPPRHIPLCVLAPTFRREVTLHDWFGASRSSNARRALAPRTDVSPECRVRGGRAQQCARKSRVYATTRATRSVGSRGDGKTRGRRY